MYFLWFIQDFQDRQVDIKSREIEKVFLCRHHILTFNLFPQNVVNNECGERERGSITRVGRGSAERSSIGYILICFCV